jgi:hypothetical protein
VGPLSPQYELLSVMKKDAEFKSAQIETNFPHLEIIVSP